MDRQTIRMQRKQLFYPHHWIFMAIVLTHLFFCVSTTHASSYSNYEIPFPSNLILLVSVGILVFNKNRTIGTCAVIAWIFGLLLSIWAWIHYLIATVLFGLIFLFIRFVIRKIKERTSERNNRLVNSDINQTLSVSDPDTTSINSMDSKKTLAKKDRIFLIVCAVLVIAGIIAVLLNDTFHALENPSTSSHLNDGITSAIYGQYFEAISHYDLAIKVAPANDSAYYWRGKAKAELNQHTAAIIDYNKAIRLNPFDGDAYAGRGWSKYRLKRYTGALTDFDKAITMNPDASRFYSDRSIVRFNLGQRAGAMLDANKAIRRNPYYGDLYRIRGWMKYELGRLFEAIADCDEALRLEPNNAEAYFYRGLAKRDLGHHSLGRKDLEQALHYAEEVGDLNLRSRINDELRRTRQ